MSTHKTVSQLCEEYALDAKGLAERANLEPKRAAAIIEGRWTPSPAERARIALVFRVDIETIAWGYQVSVEHLHGHGPQFGRTP